ncbi:MAG: IPT/TIG domain-containing protein [Planctomycetota bacterium]|jgi:hypothetical protein
MRLAFIPLMLFVLCGFSFAQDALPPVGTNQKAAPSPDEPSFDLPRIDAPEIHSIDPVEGPAAGGTAVTVIGKRFTTSGDTTVDFGDTSATDVNVVNSTTLTCTTPGHAAGTVDVIVTNGNGSDTLPGAFTYHNPPSLDSIDPVDGPSAGGTAVTLEGNYFTTSGDTTVAFGGASALDVVVVDPSTITCTTPAHAAGAVDVTVTNSNGADTLPGAFTYHDPPQIASIDPDNGPETGGTPVTILGSHFTAIGITTVTFGESSATSVVVVNTTTITCTTPAHAPFVVDVVVVNDFGSDTLVNGFTYNSTEPAIHVPGDYPTIQEAVDAAVDGDTILVAPGIYVENIVFPAKEILVRSDVDGTSGTFDISPETTFIDGNQSGVVITFQGGRNGDPSLIGFTIVNGYNPYFLNTAGGIYCEEDSAPTIMNNIIIGNRCDFGTGGLKSDASSSSQMIANNIVSGNSSHFAGSGGMMIVGSYASHSIAGNIISGNSSEVTCGGLSVSGIGSSHSVVNNYIAGNYGSICGGLSVGGWETNVVTATNNTVTGNRAAQKGGGLSIGGWLIAYVANTISWNNDAPTGPEICMNKAAFGPSELFISFSDVEGGQGLVHVDPTCTLNWGSGMMDSAPLFAAGPSSTWTSNGVYDAPSYQVTFTDSLANWATNEFAGKLINPDTTQDLQLYIVSNTSTTITIWADWDTIDAGASWVSTGDTYQINDYHLAGGSPCIDVGDNFAPDIPDEDIEGDDRILDGDGDLIPEVDLGVDEYQP